MMGEGHLIKSQGTRVVRVTTNRNQIDLKELKAAITQTPPVPDRTIAIKD